MNHGGHRGHEDKISFHEPGQVMPMLFHCLRIFCGEEFYTISKASRLGKSGNGAVGSV